MTLRSHELITIETMAVDKIVQAEFNIQSEKIGGLRKIPTPMLFQFSHTICNPFLFIIIILKYFLHRTIWRT